MQDSNTRVMEFTVFVHCIYTNSQCLIYSLIELMYHLHPQTDRAALSLDFLSPSPLGVQFWVFFPSLRLPLCIMVAFRPTALVQSPRWAVPSLHLSGTCPPSVPAMEPRRGDAGWPGPLTARRVVSRLSAVNFPLP